jgi:hypothetical protein
MPGRSDHDKPMPAPLPQPQAREEGASTVGVYDRPHPLRTRRVLVPVAVALVVAAAYALWFLLR